MKLIGLTGEYGWGKDAVWEIIDTETQRTGQLALRRAFADPLKISGLRALGLGNEDEYTHEDYIALANSIKDSGHVTVSWVDHKGALRASAITGRALWQLYGTEAHRVEDLGFSFKPNFWVDNILPEGEIVINGAVEDHDYGTRPKWWYSFQEGWAGFADYAIIPDVRFENEADRIHACGGEVWLVDAAERIGHNGDGHPSESGLPREMIDRVIDNNQGFEELELNTYVAMAALDDADD